MFGSGNPNEDGAVCFPEAVQWYNGIRQRIRELSFPRQHHFSGSRALSALAGRLHFTGGGLNKMSTRYRDDCILIVDVSKSVDDQPGKTNGKAIGPGIYTSPLPCLQPTLTPLLSLRCVSHSRLLVVV